MQDSTEAGMVKRNGKRQISDCKIMAGLLLIALLFRLPFFFPPVINWDESSSILMGHSIATGHLPYTELWNVKPPLLYYVFSAFLLVFGNSIEAVRLGGTLCVAVAAMCVFVIGKRMWDRSVGVVAAIVSILLMSTLGGGQSTMSEHLALVPLLGSLLVLLSPRETVMRAVLAGLLLSAAGLIRLNLAYVAAGAVIFVMMWPSSDGFRARLLRAVAMSLAGLLLIVATFVPHVIYGSAQQWITAVVQAPISYSAAQRGILVSSLMLLAYFLLAGWGIGLTVVIANFVGLWRRCRPGMVLGHRAETLLLVYATTTLYSVLVSGGAFQHYLIQVAPFAALFAARVLVVSYRNRTSARGRTAWRGVAVLLLVTASLPSLAQYVKMTTRAIEGQALSGGAEYAIADYLRPRLGPTESLYMMGDHIVYWLLDRLPVDRSVTHPSNIAKPYLIKHMPGIAPKVEDAMLDLLAKAPRYIVEPRDISYMSGSPETVALVQATLKSRYVLEAELSGRKIYRLDDRLAAAAGPIRKPSLASAQAAPGVIKVAQSDKAKDGKAEDGKAQGGKAKKPIPVRAERVEKGESRSYLGGLGTVGAVSSVVVRTRVDGQLVKLYGREGSTVKKGQLLAEIDARPLEVKLAQAEAKLARDRVQLQSAKEDLERYKSLVDRQFISQQKVESQDALVRQYAAVLAVDQTDVDGAKLELSYARITAPAGGQLGLRLVDEGNVVRSSDPTGIVVINQMDPVNVVFSVPEAQLSRLLPAWRTGKPLAVEAWDREFKQLLKRGRLLSLNNQVDASTGTVRAKAEFDNEDLALFPNQFVNVKVLLSTRPDALQAPAAAIQHGRDGAFVYVVGADNTVSRRPVKLGVGDTRSIEVLGGLQAGELVVTDGVDRLREGSLIEVVDPRAPLDKKPLAALDRRDGR